MDVLETLNDVRGLPQTTGDPLLQEKLRQVEEQVVRLLREKQEAVERCERLQVEFAAKLRSIRHDAAQPLTTLQFFLDLLPSALQQDRLVMSQMTNQNFWTNTYNRAQEAVKSIPRILQS